MAQSTYSLSFGGTNYCGTSVNLPITGDVAFTMSFWIFLRNGVTGAGAINFGAAGAMNGIAMYYGYRGTNILGFEGGGNQGIWSNLTVPIGAWHHVVLSKSPGPCNTTAKYYVDGVLGTLDGGVTTSTPNFTPALFTIGKTPYSNGDASIDDVRFYSRQLTNTEVGQLYAGGNPTTNDPLLWWQIEEGTGFTVADASGNGYTGTISGLASSPSWDTDTPPLLTSSTYSLNFIATVGQFVQCPNLPVFDGGNQWTIAYWFETTSAKFVIAGQYNSNSTEYVELMRYGLDNNIYCIINKAGVTSYGLCPFTGTGWHHASAVYDGSGSTNADKLKIYLDGTAQTLSFPGAIIPTTSQTSGGSWLMGKRVGNTTDNMTGNMDDVRIYNRPLTPTEAGQLGIGVDPTINDPIHWWKMENTGNVVIDSIGGKNGTVAPTWTTDVPAQLQSTTQHGEAALTCVTTLTVIGITPLLGVTTLSCVSSLAVIGRTPNIIDDSDATGFTQVGAGWTIVNDGVTGYDGTYRYFFGGDNTNSATWTFTGLRVTDYQVQAQWTASGNRSASVPYRIYDDTTLVGTIFVNQQGASGGIFVGAGWGFDTTAPCYNGRYAYIAAGTGLSTATWKYPNLDAGTYELQVCWLPFGNRATNATYKIYNNSTLIDTVVIDQTLAPTGGAVVSGVPFQVLGTYTIAHGFLNVQLSDNANAFVIADAVRLSGGTLPSPIFIDDADAGEWGENLGTYNITSGTLKVTVNDIGAAAGFVIADAIRIEAESVTQHGVAALTCITTVAAVAASNSIGTAAGNSTAIAVGASSVDSAGVASGNSTANASGLNANLGIATATGDSTATGVGASVVTSSGTISGNSTAIGQATSNAIANATASGDSTATGVGASTISSAGTASGDSTAAGVGASTLAGIGTAPGDSTATGVGAIIIKSVGTAHGDSTANAIGLTAFEITEENTENINLLACLVNITHQLDILRGPLNNYFVESGWAEITEENTDNVCLISKLGVIEQIINQLKE